MKNAGGRRMGTLEEKRRLGMAGKKEKGWVRWKEEMN